MSEQGPKYPPMPQSKEARILAISDELLKDLIDRVMLDGVNEENTFDDDDYFPCNAMPIIAAITAYAKQFHVRLIEGETIEGWLGRITPVLEGKSNGVTFLAMMKAIVAAAQGIDTDELDTLIQKNKPQTTGGPGYGPGPLQPPQHVCNGACGPNGHVPSTPMSPVRGCPCGCNSTGKATIPTVALSPAFKRAIGVGQVAAPKKDSLLNPPAKGFIGSDKYGYDPDVD